MRTFRDKLRADPVLVEAYVAPKRVILAEGITEGVDCAEAKTEFVRNVLAS